MGARTTSINDATNSVKGIVELATDAETLAASSDSVVMTPGNFSSVIVRKVKTADETVNNSAVFQADDHISLAVGANEVWTFTGMILQTSSANSTGLQVGWYVPTGAAIYWTNDDYATSTLSMSINLDDEWITYQETSVGRIGGGGISGVYVGGANGGTLQLYWSQAIADASDAILRKGTNVIFTRLA